MSFLCCASLLATLCSMPRSADIDLTAATVVVRENGAPLAEKTAVTVLIEEAEKRTGVRWTQRAGWPESGTVVVATSNLDDVAGGRNAPDEVRKSVTRLKPEGYVIAVDLTRPKQPVVWVVGADARGVLFGVGKLLRQMKLTKGAATLDGTTRLVTSPAYPIRGHQLGYRNRANSWDAWDVRQFDQYIRELAIFGANCVENIPFQDDSPGPLMRVPRPEMNVRMSEICQRYDQDYWLWTPADFDLADTARRAKAIQDHEALYKACPRLDGIFIPGGDPGENQPSLVIPFMKDLSVVLARHHPKAKIWLSLQGFRGDRAEYVYRFLDQEKPVWFGGIVCGPSSPSIPSTRKRLDLRYPIRSYPDITHNVRCQYPIPWWDTALAVTLGREAINPRPVQFAEIHNASARDTAGFISYSDGVHDDVNKVLWNVLAWDSDTPPREILIEYARFFFAPEIAETAADGILALERNWIGSLRDNGGVDATLALWNGLEKQAPALDGNWRWQMCLVRAVYDAYTRHRLIYESALADEANAKLAQAPTQGSLAAMAVATAVLRRAETEPVRRDLRGRIDKLCEELFRSIALQTSMSRYKASGAERGCILDFVDYPLNSRWWLEDEFKAIGALPSEPEKLARLELVRTWEHPGAGSFYDDVGNVARSPHVVLGDLSLLGLRTARTPIPEVLWWDEGASRKRLAWMDVMNWPLAMHYTGLDPKADYVIRTTGYGTCLLSIDGERVRPAIEHKGIGEFTEFPVPKPVLADGTLHLTFERPVERVNWRYQSRLSELWLLKK
jgi:hypothetical protein